MNINIALGSILAFLPREHDGFVPKCENPRCKARCTSTLSLYEHPIVVLQIEKRVSGELEIIFASTTTLHGTELCDFTRSNPQDFRPGDTQYSPILARFPEAKDIDPQPKYKFANSKTMRIQTYFYLPHTYRLPIHRFRNFMTNQKDWDSPQADLSHRADFILDKRSYELLMKRVGFRKLRGKWEYKEKYITSEERLRISPLHSGFRPASQPPSQLIAYASVVKRATTDSSNTPASVQSSRFPKASGGPSSTQSKPQQPRESLQAQPRAQISSSEFPPLPSSNIPQASSSRTSDRLSRSVNRKSSKRI